MSKTAKARVRTSGEDSNAEAVNTASEDVIKKAAKTKTVISADGLTLVVRRLGPLQRMKLADVVGPMSAQNPAYIGTAAIAASIVSIDGEPIPFPANKRELEAIVQRLDDDGISAAGDALAELNNITHDEDGNVYADGKLVVLASAKN